MIFFTSDEHFGHRNIIKFCKRPFTDLEDMREGLIARHNEVVGKEDQVYHLGDMFWRTLKTADVLDTIHRLNGFHYYILGNHEEVFREMSGLKDKFGWVRDRAHIVPAGGPRAGIVLDHFAGRVWHQSDKGSWQLYGHSHGELPEDHGLLSFDVGVDANNWYPVSLDRVRERMEERLQWMQRKIVGSAPAR